MTGYDPYPDHDETNVSSAPEAAGHPVVDTVNELLAEVDSIRAAAGDEFDLGALARQSALLERAHDALTEALDDVDRAGPGDAL